MRRFSFLLLAFLLVNPSYSQVRPKTVNPRSNALIDVRPQTLHSSETNAMFQKIEKGIVSGSVESFNTDFGKQVSMTITGTETGYYSAGQAFLILQNFFSTRKPTQFSFTRMSDMVASPYATGRLSLIRRGGRESVQVYVSLARQDSSWVITQFNIY